MELHEPAIIQYYMYIEFEVMIFKGNVNTRFKPLTNSHFKVADK